MQILNQIKSRAKYLLTSLLLSAQVFFSFIFMQVACSNKTDDETITYSTTVSASLGANMSVYDFQLPNEDYKRGVYVPQLTQTRRRTMSENILLTYYYGLCNPNTIDTNDFTTCDTTSINTFTIHCHVPSGMVRISQEFTFDGITSPAPVPGTTFTPNRTSAGTQFNVSLVDNFFNNNFNKDSIVLECDTGITGNTAFLPLSFQYYPNGMQTSTVGNGYRFPQTMITGGNDAGIFSFSNVTGRVTTAMQVPTEPSNYILSFSNGETLGITVTP